ncbi:hypothetical protein AB0N07_00445 [Streptomyces sp. NPDC051172]|uniref:hypothetical protein n=1 Tax=Streptomyces sp. NPDC051172 TaxID=3155796 RepID=UPI00343A5217
MNDYLSRDLVHTTTARLAGRFGGFAVLPLGAPAGGTLPCISYRTSLLTVTPAVAQQWGSAAWTTATPPPS